MEISGKVLREVEFRDRLRGYDTDEVDEFLERVAVALDELLEDHAALRQRAERLERQLADAPFADDDSIRRTLVLAQRTADMALHEARQEAEQIVGEARARAETALSDAEAAAARVREETDREVRDRSVRLSEEHDRLTDQIRVLASLLESERARLSQSLSEALRFVNGSMAVSGEAAAVAAAGDGPPQAGAAALAGRGAPSGLDDGGDHAVPVADHRPGTPAAPAAGAVPPSTPAVSSSEPSSIAASRTRPGSTPIVAGAAAASAIGAASRARNGSAAAQALDDLPPAQAYRIEPGSGPTA
jgi:cell division initiation protein